MIITVPYSQGNPRRHKAPWIARIVSWPAKGPERDYGNYDRDSQELEVEAEPGDFIMYGQLDSQRRPWEHDRRYAQVQEDGSLKHFTAKEAKTLVRAQKEKVET